ncbi:vacuolar protein sorting 55 [Globomyces pollinis-pini]|nr:vacuolar protein sorting 55 [Globomyces pollinis-pini]
MSMVTIIGLAFFLATGVLLVILSCALDNNWLPLLVVLTYLIAPLPNIVCKRIAGMDDYFHDEPHKGVLETGYFLTSFFIVSGFGLPLVLHHANILTQHATILSLIGGLLIYTTILGYIHFFTEREQSY